MDQGFLPLAGMIVTIILFVLYMNQRNEIIKYKTEIQYLQSRLKDLNTGDPEHEQEDTPPAPAASSPVLPAPTLSSAQVSSHCPFCGAKLSPGSASSSINFCPFCGEEVAPDAAVNKTPAPLAQPAPLPVYSAPPEPADAEPSRQGVSMAMIILILGVIFILTAGTIFATTTWNTMANPLRALIIFTLPVFFIAVSLITDKILKLSMTGRAFYYLGCFFIPVAFLAISQFEILGEWFTFSGEGLYAIWTVCLGLFALACAFGVLRYRHAVFVYLAGFSATATVWSTAQLLGGSQQVALLAVSLLSLACIIFLRKIRSGTMYRHWQIYAHLNIPLNALLFFSGDSTQTVFEVMVLLVVFATYTMCVFGEGKFQKLFLDLYSVAAGWFAWSLIGVLVGGAGDIETITEGLSIGVKSAAFGTAGSGLLFFIFRFAPRIFGVKLRNSLSDILFIPIMAILIPLWLSLSEQYSFYWLALACIAMLAVMVTIIGADKERPFAVFFAALTPFVLLSLCAPIAMIANEHFPPEQLSVNPVHLAAFLTFAVVAAIGIILSFRKEGMRQKQFSVGFHIAVSAWGFVWLLAMLASASYIASWYMLSLGIYFAAAFAAEIKKGSYQSFWVWTSGFTLTLSPFMFVFCYTEASWLALLNILALSATAILIIPLTRLVQRKPPVLPEIVNISAILLNACAVFGVVSCTLQPSALGIISVAVMALLSIFSLYLAKKNVLNFIGVLVLWAIALVGSMELSSFTFGEGGYHLPLITVSVMFVAMLIFGRLIFGKNLLRKTSRGQLFDYLSISGLIAPLVYFMSTAIFGIYNAKVVHGALLIAIVYVLSFWGRRISRAYKPFDKLALSLAIVLGAIALLAQPYFTMPGYISTEYALVVLLVAVAALSFIWRNRKLAKHGVFMASVFAVIVQFGDILAGNHMLFDALLLGIIMAIMLFASFFLKKGRWFFLSATTLSLSALYLSRNFWLNINWWVYLLVCGTIMIIAAAVYEYRRRSSKTHEEEEEEEEEESS